MRPTCAAAYAGRYPLFFLCMSHPLRRQRLASGAAGLLLAATAPAQHSAFAPATAAPPPTQAGARWRSRPAALAHQKQVPRCRAGASFATAMTNLAGSCRGCMVARAFSPQVIAPSTCGPKARAACWLCIAFAAALAGSFMPPIFRLIASNTKAAGPTGLYPKTGYVASSRQPA